MLLQRISKDVFGWGILRGWCNFSGWLKWFGLKYIVWIINPKNFKNTGILWSIFLKLKTREFEILPVQREFENSCSSLVALSHKASLCLLSLELFSLELYTVALSFISVRALHRCSLHLELFIVALCSHVLCCSHSSPNVVIPLILISVFLPLSRSV